MSRLTDERLAELYAGTLHLGGTATEIRDARNGNVEQA